MKIDVIWEKEILLKDGSKENVIFTFPKMNYQQNQGVMFFLISCENGKRLFT